MLLAAGAGAALLLRSPGWGIFAVAVLFLSLEAFFLPTRYRLGEEGLEIRRVFSRSLAGWARFRRVYEDDHGLTLSPYRRRSLLEPYRSFRLLFDGGDREEIRRIVRARLGPDADWHGAGEPSCR